MTALFISKVTAFGPRLMKDIGLTIEEAAAVYGNIGHESSGFAVLQEQGKRHGQGGWGWCQWTGARRNAFNAFAHSHRLSLDSDEANYEYLCFELRGMERAAVSAMKRSTGLQNKTASFMRVFERPGVPALNHRLTWARLALQTLQHAHGDAPAPQPLAHSAVPKVAASKPRGVALAKKAAPRSRHHRHA